MICENIPKYELDILHKSQEFVAEKRETVGTAEKSECTGKAAPLSAGRQTAAETVS